jgi:hypothetical protein
MRLPKTLYIVEMIQSEEPTSIDPFGQAIYGEIPEKTPLLGEVEPYSSKLAETQYGVFAEVHNRLYCYPNPNIKFHTLIEYEDELYKVVECMKYDRHYEVLLKKEAKL